jgi:hypothetical protein
VFALPSGDQDAGVERGWRLVWPLHAPICGPCADRMQTRGCEPFIKQIEQALEAGYRRSQFRKLAGL